VSSSATALSDELGAILGLTGRRTEETRQKLEGCTRQPQFQLGESWGEPTLGDTSVQLEFRHWATAQFSAREEKPRCRAGAAGRRLGELEELGAALGELGGAWGGAAPRRQALGSSSGRAWGLATATG
jgi:hypothetical protein